MKKPLKSQLHHWWPRTLSTFWRAEDGMVSAVRPDGTVQRAPPGAFGAITNAHHEKLGGPWNSTFEPIFNRPDSEIADLVGWLFTLDAAPFVDQPFLDRIKPQPLPQERQHQLARVVASLLARSPRIRNNIRITTEYYRGRMGFADPQADKNLIAANQRGLYDAYRTYMEAGGRWAVLFSDAREFIAGDGFLHNFPASRDGINSGKKLILPLLPTATIIFMRPMSHPSEPKLVTMRVDGDETQLFNEVVQAYSRDVLFFRTDKPTLTESFRAGEYRQFRYHQNDWIDGLLDDLSQFNLWGPNGTPSRSRESPYTESIEGTRWLDGFASDPD